MAGEPVMSAFAARKKLLAKYNSAATEAKSSNAGDEDGSGVTTPSKTEQKRRKASTALGAQGGDGNVKTAASQRKRRRVTSKDKSAEGEAQEDVEEKPAPATKQKQALPSRSRSPSTRAKRQIIDAEQPSPETEMQVDGTPVAKKSSETAISKESRKPETSPLPALISEASDDSSALRLVIQNCSTQKENGVLELRIDSEERLKLPIVGQYGIRVLRGEVFIAGATLRPSSDIIWVHAPLCHSVPILRCPDSSVLELHPHPSSDGFRQLGRLSPLYRNIWNRSQPDSVFGNPFYQIVCGPEDLPKKSVLRPLYSPPEWNKKLAELAAEGTKSMPCLVCGPKGSGKSTFTRLLTNRLLTLAKPSSSRRTRAAKEESGILLLDLDPGQSEFCPPGTVSLVLVRKPNISPPFAHPWPDASSATLVRCHTLASVNPGSDTDLFIECALDLYSHYQQMYNGYPLVVNTSGWILGTGLDLLALLIGSLKPAEVIYMSEDGPAETVEGLRLACKTSTFSMLPSRQSDAGTRRSAAHLRAMQTMAYFHSEQQQKLATGHIPVNPSPLSAIAPWRVSYTGKKRGIAGIITYSGQLESALLAEAINGMVLAAVEIEDEKAFRRSPSSPSSLLEAEQAMDVDTSDGARILQCADELIMSSTTAPEGIPHIELAHGDTTLDIHYCRTIGLVLVRGVDTENSALQILTPIPRSKLEEVRQNGRHVVLVHGQFDAPTWAYTEDLYEQAANDRESGGAEGLDDDEVEENEDDEAVGEDGVAVVGAGSFGVDRPWVEGVESNRRRQVGGGTWRVRRDLGRHNR